MFNKFFSRRLRMELEELKHSHHLVLEKMGATMSLQKRQWEEERIFIEKNIRAEHDIKLKEAVTMTRLDAEQRIKKAELNAEGKLNDRTAALNKEYYDKLSEAMSKLHQEGNVTTKFTQDLALKMFENSPVNRTTTKVLTGKTEKDD